MNTRTIVAPLMGPDDTYRIAFEQREFVKVGKRLRETNPKTVADIAASIQIMGILEPILCTPKDTKGFRTLLAGANRWAAMQRVWADNRGDEARFSMPCRTIHIGDDDWEAVEIAENLLRADLTPKEREVMGARYLAMTQGKAQTEEKLTGDKKLNELSWFVQWYTATNIPAPTAKRLWDAYRTATGVTSTPAKASETEQRAFPGWVLARAAAEEAAKQAKGSKEKAAGDAKHLAAAISLFDKQVATFTEQLERACADNVPRALEMRDAWPPK